jgi:quercetin dioxygenase-like cupin family protein
MKSTLLWITAAGLLGLVALIAGAQTSSAQKHKAVFITHLFTGPDGQTHAEEIEANFTPGNGNDVFKMMNNAGAELHRAPAGRFSDWHTAPRRQYVITLSGHGELEVAGGKKIPVGPGHIELVEDTTGKGHITRVTGNEERVTIQIPLTDQGKR